MKRKITRLGIEELRDKMYVLNTLEQRTIIGGERVNINGGYLEEVNGGVYYYGNNGCSVFFEGVEIWVSNLIRDYSAYQLNGTIGIESDWCNTSFNIYDFAHEYGHYLQQKTMGTYDYLTVVVPNSLYSATFNDPYTHSQQTYELQATLLGNEYLKNNTKQL